MISARKKAVARHWRTNGVSIILVSMPRILTSVSILVSTVRKIQNYHTSTITMLFFMKSLSTSFNILGYTVANDYRDSDLGVRSRVSVLLGQLEPTFEQMAATNCISIYKELVQERFSAEKNNFHCKRRG